MSGVVIAASPRPLFQPIFLLSDLYNPNVGRTDPQMELGGAEGLSELANVFRLRDKLSGEQP